MITLPTLTFTTLLFGTIANATDDGQGSPKHLYALDDNSVVWFCDANIRVIGKRRIDIYVVDLSGAVTWYATNYYNAVDGYINTLTCFGAGFFSMTLSDANGAPSQTFNFRVANQKLNNSSPILFFPGGTSLSNPCAAGQPPQPFYDSVAGILGVGFYNPEGGSGNTQVFASNYKIDASGLAYLSSGYVGPFPTGAADPWNQTGSVPGGAPYKSGQLGNGSSVSVGVPNTGYWFAQQSYKVVPGADNGAGNCAFNPTGASVTTRSATQLYTTATTGQPYFVDSTLPGVYGISIWGGAVGGVASYGAILPLSPGLYFWLPVGFTVPGVWYNVQTFVLTKKALFGLGKKTDGSLGIVMSSAAPSGIYTASNTYRSRYGLTNFARPVSIIGKYKA